MLGYAALKPDRSPLGIYADMPAAQLAIATVEPDVIKQSLYQIHPIGDSRDADALNLKIQVHYCLEKFDGTYTGQEPVEVITGDG